MSTQKEQTASSILEQFNQPGDFTISGLQRTLIRVQHDAFNNLGSIFDSEDNANIYYLTEALAAIEEWQLQQEDKLKAMQELYSAGISMSELNSFTEYVAKVVLSRKDCGKHADTLKKILQIIGKS
jgi:hypothetical protein